MASGRPAGSQSYASAMQHILELGEDLLSIAQEAAATGLSPAGMLARQCKRIIETSASLAGGETHLWLSADALRSHIGKETGHPALNASGAIRSIPTPLMQACFDSQQTLGEPDQTVRLAIPLTVQDRPAHSTSRLGVLQIERRDGPAFTPDEIDLLRALAQQSALMLQSNLRLTSERWRREQLALVHQVTRQIASLRDLDQIANQVARLILQTFDYYYAAIFTLEPGQPRLNFRASAGPLNQSEEPTSPVFFSVDLGQGIIGHVAQSGQELLAGDVCQEPLYEEFDQLPETRSEFALPLVAQERLLGVLDVQSNQPNDFDEMDRLVLRALAGNIAIAIEDAQLYQDLIHRADQLQMIYEVSSAITSILDQDELLHEVVRLIQERVGHPYVHIFTVHPGRQKVLYEAGSGLRSQAVTEEYAYDLDDPHGLIPWVARSGKTALVNDVRQEPRYRPSSLPPEGTLSELTVGLVFGGQVLGVLDVQSDRLNAFSEEDRFLFESLADQIAIALRNASLYRSEVWRRGVADSLREVAGILAAEVDLDQVLAAVLAELEHTLPLDAAAIWLVDDTTQLETSGNTPDLYLASVRSSGAFSLDLELGLRPEEVLKYDLDETGLESQPNVSAWLYEALSSDAPIVRTPQSLTEPLGSILKLPADYSAIAAPLRSGTHLLGVLCLVDHSPRRYGSEARAMTAAFASYAAVAIENARLYEDAHEQAWIATVLLQVANAAQSAADLPELLDTVVRITPTLTGVKACLLYMLDDDGAFVPAAATGLDAEQLEEFECGRFTAGDVPAFDRLLTDHHAVILSGEADWRLMDILSTAEEAGKPLGTGLPVLVPLAARGEVLGAFLVEYSASLPAPGLGKSFDAYLDERLAILQGIAHQTAIAVDNIRLLKAQKEEAYVSVALLQAAQAVVSSNELDEALGSIVRITPILVGVKRAMIFLWHEEHRHFLLSQSYGAPREVESRTFSQGEFSLLESVLATNSLVVLPAPVIDNEHNVLDYWADLDVSDSNAQETLLSEESCLLMAFPLAVRGKVLGVFLVEEPDPTSGEGYTSANANRRLRPKRMEIITGISQQAALAIQNDLLQQEIVERGRLEREMQLARQIQAAFLPQQKPEMPGWELQAYWRPARQVGGDFYDFFELPGNKLGLVIADVADKGMPAALFMTLVRTLVRATVQILDSPASVLGRVNDLLVPDATDGMFVTLVYAVLDLASGEIRLANAGHSPPLFVQRACRIERATRGGMALGIEAGTPIQETHWQLDPGELLMMYTDGVTETFSPDNEMFGEERLEETLRQVFRCSDPQEGPDALVVLEAIDQQVLEFAGEADPYDDLTLMVLKRVAEQ